MQASVSAIIEKPFWTIGVVMQKQRVQKVLDNFPEEVNVDEFLEKVYLLQKIEIGERQIEAGEIISHEDAKQRLQKWLA
jgi:hypothetical protein